MKKQNDSDRSAFTLVELMIVVGIIGLLAAVVIPSYVRTRAKTQATACINNLRQIDSSVQQFALENGKAAGSTINYPDDLTPFIKMNADGKMPGCPAGGTYSLTQVGNIPSVLCSLGSTVDPAHLLP
jgi:prepilin-type N-terminal cleavage/methylation domain-containing protein